jgi:hypothetical protein
MIIIKCDICENTINQNEENGKLIYIEKTFQLIKNKQEPGFRQVEMIFCKDCIREMRAYLHTQRESKKDSNK